MPELPEVFNFKKYVDSTSLHQTIEDVVVNNGKVLRISPGKLRSSLKGKEFESTVTHGKYLFLETNNVYQLVLHFGMTGHPVYYKREDQEPDYPRVVFEFENRFHLAFDCMRVLGNVTLIEDRELFLKEKELGPDALRDIDDPEIFFRLLKNRRGIIKTALMDQSLIAGIGNVCSDEILFQSGIHPRRSVPSLDKTELRILFDNIHVVLETYINAGLEYENMPDNFLFGHRSEGADCPSCGGSIEKIKVGSRTAYYCPDCQRM